MFARTKLESFARAFLKARGVLGRRPESSLASDEIPLSFEKGRRGEFLAQSDKKRGTHTSGRVPLWCMMPAMFAQAKASPVEKLAPLGD